MKISKYNISDTNQIRHFESENKENVNPWKYFRKRLFPLFHDLSELEYDAVMLKKGINLPQHERVQVIFRRANELNNEAFDKISKTKIPIQLKSLLNANSKRDQIKALKGFRLTSNELESFFLFAYKEKRLLHSFYHFTFKPKSTDNENLPNLMYLEKDGSLKVSGESSLSRGKLKQIIEHQKLMMVKTIQNKKEWHCFFYTSNGIAGTESYSGGSHIHYVSNKWNYDRLEIIKILSKREYTINSIHIDFENKQE